LEEIFWTQSFESCILEDNVRQASQVTIDEAIDSSIVAIVHQTLSRFDSFSRLKRLRLDGRSEILQANPQVFLRQLVLFDSWIVQYSSRKSRVYLQLVSIERRSLKTKKNKNK